MLLPYLSFDDSLMPGLLVTTLTATQPQPLPLIIRSFLKCRAKYNQPKPNPCYVAINRNLC